MTFIRSDSDEDEQTQELVTRSERITIAAMLIVVGLFTALDVYEDWLDGSGYAHIIPEVLTIFLVTGIALYLIKRFAKSRRSIIAESRAEISAVKEQAIIWQQQAINLKKGVSEAIVTQLSSWGLTQAEQDITFLILKGLSIKEIADLRETAERTVRQQASEIYRKSGLSGRAQLSAFFLEDLFSG